MNMIDIQKLNAEVDKLIATQDAEIAVLKEKYNEQTLYRFQNMMSQFEEYAVTASEIGEPILVFVGKLKSSPYDWGVKFDSKYSCSICWHSGVMVWEPSVRLRFGDKLRLQNQITEDLINWWWDNATEFHTQFADKCIGAIKWKAERANKDYAEEKARLQSAVSGLDS